ncbi:MAG: response regulator [Kineosporiaceae bacterium]
MAGALTDRPGAAPEGGSAAAPYVGRVVVVEDQDRVRKAVAIGLRSAGYLVVEARDGVEALSAIEDVRPDLVISDLVMPRLDGMELLHLMRANIALRDIPVLLLTARADTDTLVAGLGSGADDYLVKPFATEELLARVRAKIERPPVPAEQRTRERATGALSPVALDAELARELARIARGGQPGVLAHVGVDEAAALRERLGPVAETQVRRGVLARAEEFLRPLDLAGVSPSGDLVLLLPDLSAQEAADLLGRLSTELGGRDLAAGSDSVRVTPAVGFVLLSGDGISVEEAHQRARAAQAHAAARLDLQPVRWRPDLSPPGPMPGGPRSGVRDVLTLSGQLAAFGALAVVLPFTVYVVGYRLGVDATPFAYLVVVLALLGTALLIWVEGFLAGGVELPPPVDGPYPPAAAIIAAYLPNEAATIVETVRSFLAVEYPGSFEVLLAYNTPHDLPVEAVLRDLARANPRLRLLRVPGGTSKSQNVNHALGVTSAELIGIFDADHHPEPGNFTRAWRWLAHGFDVVQGHNVIRNGGQSWVARTVAVEFEQIYAVSHPGRARLHDFGIFGGSNGYWRAATLRRTRMHDVMLTEDIDSSMRVLCAGGRIGCDPGLVSRELAPVSVHALWNQRLRWAQGWFQVGLRHLSRVLRAPGLSLRQKVGMLHLLLWRELYPWISLQVLPIIAFWIWRDHGMDRIDWAVPVFVLTTALTLSSGPAQTAVAYLRGHPEVTRNRWWFWRYLIVSVLLYSTFKAAVSVIAQLRQVAGVRQWPVTPRGVPGEAP